MIGLLSKARVYLIMFAAFATFAGVAYAYYKDTQSALQQYAENNATLEVALETQKAATVALQRDIKLMSTTLVGLNKDFEEARQRVSDLEKTFNESANGDKRDFGALAEAKPGLVERAVNKGTVEVFNCIEILSGKQGDYSEAEYINCTSTDANGMQ